MPRREFSRTTKVKAFDKACGKCEACGKKLNAGDRIEYDHRIPDAIGKSNALDNCQVLCGPCHKLKTAVDRKDIAKVERIRAKNIGAKSPRYTMPGSRKSRWKRKMNGEVVPRE